LTAVKNLLVALDTMRVGAESSPHFPFRRQSSSVSSVHETSAAAATSAASVHSALLSSSSAFSSLPSSSSAAASAFASALHSASRGRFNDHSNHLHATPLHLQVTGTGATGDAADAVAQRLGAGEIGATILKNMPRFGFAASLSAVVGGSSSDQVGYGIGIAIQFAYGLVLAVLTLLVGCCFCWCRCCCNWCGAREPLEGGYTKCQRWGTWLIMLVFALGVVCVCPLALFFF
jgi:hypothetical protein